MTRANFLAVAVVVGFLTLGGCESSNPRLRMLGREALRVNDLSEAEHLLSKAVDQDPTDWESQWLLGKVYLKQNRPLDARLVLGRSWTTRDRHPETPEIVDDLAEALYQAQEHDRLKLVLDEASRRYTTSYDFMRQGKYLTKIGDIDNAIVAYRKAARFSAPKDAEPWLAIAGLYESIQDRKRAAEAYQQAYRVNPEDPRVLRGLERLGEIPGPTLPVPEEE